MQRVPWAAREVKGVGAISNAMTISGDWQRCTIPEIDGNRTDFASQFENKSMVAAVGAHKRRQVAYDWLKVREGTITSAPWLPCCASILKAMIRQLATSVRTSACMLGLTPIASGRLAAP